MRSLVHLPADVGKLDLLIVGGGHLVRFDKEVALGYQPPSDQLHHPTGYWLMPTLLAACNGVPVAWNALGASLDTPSWARGLLSAALASTAYVSVRDESSLDELTKFAGHNVVRLVPDTAFGIRQLLPSTPSPELRKVLRRNRDQRAVRDRPALAAARSARTSGRQCTARGCNGRVRNSRASDLTLSRRRDGLLELETPTAKASTWPHPILLAELISRADAVIARSLHLSIVALACGVPVHRHRSASDLKYRALHGFRGVVWWDDVTNGAELLRHGLGRRNPDEDVNAQLSRLTDHWNAISQLLGRSPANGAVAAYNLIARTSADLEGLATTTARVEQEGRAELAAREADCSVSRHGSRRWSVRRTLISRSWRPSRRSHSESEGDARGARRERRATRRSQSESEGGARGTRRATRDSRRAHGGRRPLNESCKPS